MIDLKGKTAFLMGASKGMGRAIAIRLAKAGMNIAAAARTLADLKKLQTEIEGIGGICEVFSVDVLDYDKLTQALQQTQDRFGRIDVFYNGVGLGAAGSIEELSLEEIDYVLDVNIKGIIHGTKAAIPFLKEHGGNIIHVSSMASTRGLGTPPDYNGVYTATKWAINGFDECMEKYLLSRYNIRVSTLCPGTSDTNYWDKVPAAFPKEKMIPSEYIAEVVETILRAPQQVLFKQVRMISEVEVDFF